MLSTILLREMASDPTKGLLLHEQYEFHSIQRVKIRYGHPCYLVKWKKIGHVAVNTARDTTQTEECDTQQADVLEVTESVDLLDEPDVPKIHVDDGCWFLLTDENMELVKAAYPEEVNRFLLEKVLRHLRLLVIRLYSTQTKTANLIRRQKKKNTQANKDFTLVW